MCDLQTTLSLMTRHGRVSLMQMDDGRWWCKVQMHVAAAGASFKVGSDLLPSMLEAADQCLDRIHVMLGDFAARSEWAQSKLRQAALPPDADAAGVKGLSHD